MFKALVSKIENKTITVADTLETVLQAELALHDKLSEAYKVNNVSHIATLGAFILLSQFLHKHITKLSIEMQSHLQAIDDATECACIAISKNGIGAQLRQQYFQPLLGNTTIDPDKQPLASSADDIKIIQTTLTPHLNKYSASQRFLAEKPNQDQSGKEEEKAEEQHSVQATI
ncbi:MAG: hypothetical protein Tsb005_09760 [Gammaproteobacteria bacterium]